METSHCTDAFFHPGGGALIFVLLFAISLAMSEPQKYVTLDSQETCVFYDV
jgi:hypothetical protein